MKFILKPVLAAALLASTSAFAGLASPATGNGELFLTIYDDTAKVSYTLDLGVTLKTFRTDADLVRPTGTAADGVVVQAAPALLAYERTFAINEAGTEFASFAQGSTVANWRWFVTAGDQLGSLTLPNFRSLVTTVTAGQTPNALSDGGFVGALSGMSNTVSTLIANKGDADNKNLAVASNGAVFGSSGNGAYAMSIGPYVRNNGATFFNFTSDNGLNEAAEFYYFGKNNGNPTVVDQFNNSVNPGLFQIVQGTQGDYSLQYSIAAVPEAGTYALMLAGLGALGLLMARRRA